MCYYDDSGRGLVYAIHTPEHWTIQIVDGGRNIGCFADLAFNPAGQPCISYQDVSNICLKYADWNGNSWRKQVACKSVSGQFSSLAFTTSGHPLISHTAMVNGNAGLTLRNHPCPVKRC